MKHFAQTVRISMIIIGVLGFFRGSAQCPPPPPATTTFTDCHNAGFSWAFNPFATSYTYIVDQSPTVPTGLPQTTPFPGGSASGLNGSTGYYVHIEATCGATTSGFTTTAFTTPICCELPTTINATAPTFSSITISWSSVIGAAGYEYVVDQSTTDPFGSGTLTTGLSHTMSGFSPSTTYYLHLRTKCNLTTFSAWSTPIAVTTPALPPCPSPTGITVTRTATTANFSWTAASSAMAYEYLVDQSPLPSGSGTVTSLTSGGAISLTPGTKYYVHVRTDCGSSNYSTWETASFITRAANGCDAPTDVTVSNTSNTASISWTGPVEAIVYEYVVDESSSNPTVTGVNTSGTSATVYNLMADKTYFVHVRANCGPNKLSEWAEPAMFTTGAACPEPANVLPIRNGNSATITWNAANSATGYEYVVDKSASNPISIGVAITATTVTVNNLDPAAKYYAHVRTNCGNGNFSNWSSGQALIPAGISNNAQDTKISVYPNPAKDRINISIQGTMHSNATLKIMDMNGKTVREQQINTPNTSIDINGLNSGIYFYKYSDTEESYIGKLNKL